jgi:hypothetical protein
LQVSEVYIYMGDISMGKDENEEGERYYRQAYEACQAAHVACPHIVTEELLQEVKAVLEADMDSDDEEN